MKIKSPARGGRKKKDHKKSCYPTKNVAPNLPPLHGTAQTAAGRFKAECLLVQAVSPFHQELQLFSSFQDFFYVLYHDVLNGINLALDRPEIVNIHVGFVRIEIIHPLLDDLGKFFIVSKSNRMLGFISAVFGCELIFHVVQKGKGDSVFVQFIRHAKVTNSLFDNVMEHVLVINNRFISIFGWNFGEQDSRDSWEITSGCGHRYNRGIKRQTKQKSRKSNC